MKSVKGNVSQYNALVNPYNQTLAAVKARAVRVDECAERCNKLADSRPKYNDAVVDAVRKANGVADRYVLLARDPATQAAIAKANADPSHPLKLGPSPAYTTDLAFLRKCATDMASEGVVVSGTDLHVDVTINGKTGTMLCDSGAGSVSLSSETAAEFGLHATESDPSVTALLADGSHAECKVVVAPEVRVGPFIARNVECMIWPANAGKVDSLLGGSFQSHFVCRLDQQAGVLHLSPKDQWAQAAADARPFSGQQTESLASPPARRACRRDPIRMRLL